MSSAPAQTVKASASSGASTRQGGSVDTTPITTSKGAPATGAAVSSQKLTYTLKGRTMTFTYAASGKQHLYATIPEGTITAFGNSQGSSIDFGDGQDPDGADLGLATCMPKTALAPFNDKLASHQHTFSKPGTYTIKATTSYCGDKGVEKRTVSYKVTVK